MWKRAELVMARAYMRIELIYRQSLSRRVSLPGLATVGVADRIGDR
jgi:hypothetical protein